MSGLLLVVLVLVPLFLLVFVLALQLLCFVYGWSMLLPPTSAVQLLVAPLIRVLPVPFPGLLVEQSRKGRVVVLLLEPLTVVTF